MAASAVGIIPSRDHLVGHQTSPRLQHRPEDHLAGFRVCYGNAVFLMACPARNPGVGIMGHLLIVGRMALAAIHGRQRFMLLRNSLLVAFQTLGVPVQGRRVIIGHLFMAFRTLGIGVTVSRIGLCRDRRRVPNKNGQNDNLDDGCFHF